MSQRPTVSLAAVLGPARQLLCDDLPGGGLCLLVLDEAAPRIVLDEDEPRTAECPIGQRAFDARSPDIDPRRAMSEHGLVLLDTDTYLMGLEGRWVAGGLSRLDQQSRDAGCLLIGTASCVPPQARVELHLGAVRGTLAELRGEGAGGGRVRELLKVHPCVRSAGHIPREGSLASVLAGRRLDAGSAP